MMVTVMHDGNCHAEPICKYFISAMARSFRELYLCYAISYYALLLAIETDMRQTSERKTVHTACVKQSDH